MPKADFVAAAAAELSPRSAGVESRRLQARTWLGLLCPACLCLRLCYQCRLQRITCSGSRKREGSVWTVLHCAQYVGRGYRII